MSILVLDIETAPHKGTFFQTYKAFLTSQNIDEPTYMLCWAAKFVGKRKVYYGRTVEELSGLIEQADAVVTYNGDHFDLKHINRELAHAGLPPVRPVASIDLFKVIKKHFYLPSNRLEYVARYFLGKQKVSDMNYEDWKGCMLDRPKSWRKMKKYNIQDTRLTEELYLFLRPWIRNHPYVGETPELPDLTTDYECPACGSRKLELERPRRTRCYAIRVVRCKDCGTYFDGKRKKIS